jgi:hypothetical protein
VQRRVLERPEGIQIGRFQMATKSTLKIDQGTTFSLEIIDCADETCQLKSDNGLAKMSQDCYEMQAAYFMTETARKQKN